jgi:hypothetical protein
VSNLSFSCCSLELMSTYNGGRNLANTSLTSWLHLSVSLYCISVCFMTSFKPFFILLLCLCACVRACMCARARACVCVCAFLLKSLKIPKGKSESVYRRSTYNTVSCHSSLFSPVAKHSLSV